MGLSQQTDGLVRAARVSAAVAVCLFAANCAKNNGSVDSKYGVSASQRVVQAGEPVPKGGGFYRIGKPYVVGGRTYVPEENTNYKAEGIASWYGDEFHGRKTANGEVFDMTSITAAHPTLPIPSYVRVTNLKNHRSLVVRVNDRGPYANDRIIDLSVRSAKLLEFHGNGLARVRVEYVGKAPLKGSDDVKLAGTLRLNGRPLDARPTAVAVTEPQRPTVVAAASTRRYEPQFFDATPIANRGAIANAADREPGEGTTAESAASLAPRPYQRPQAIATAPLPHATQPMRVEASAHPTPESLAPRSLGTLPAPVSAYAAPRYDGSAGVMNGRGLY